MRNYTYFSSFISLNSKRGLAYNYNQEFIHLDLSCNLKYEELYREYYVMDNKGNKYVENVKIIEYNLDKIRNTFYTLNKEEKQKYKVLYMLVSTRSELRELSKGDEFIMEYKDKIEKLNNDEGFISFITKEEDDKFILNTEKMISFEEGEKKSQQTMINNLIKMNMPLEKIAQVCEISVNEVKNLINNTR